MANRQLLPIKYKDEFISWLETRGFYQCAPTNIYEVIRMKTRGKTVVVYQKDRASQHLSVRNEDVGLVRQFLSERWGRTLSKRKVYENLWAGAKTYFVCLTNNGKMATGIRLVETKEGWNVGYAVTPYYSDSLKDEKHFPVVGTVDINKAVADAILNAVKEGKENG